MAQINAGILQPIDFVGRVQQGFQQGQQQRRQADMDAALQALAANPQDPKALQMFRRADPMKAMKFEQSQQDRALKEIEASRENILKGAQIIRQLNPRDDASWRQALSIASQMGMNISQVPQNFDPQYVQSIVAIADALEPQKQSAAPADIQEYEYAKAQGFTGSFMDYQESQKGPVVASNGDGTFTIVPRDMFRQQTGAPQQQPRQLTSKAEYDALPQGAEYIDPNGLRRVKGGQPGQPSAGSFQP